MTRPIPIPVNMAFSALFSSPAPIFCETKDAIDCMRAEGTSIAKFTILHATPYPEDAARPSLFTNAQSARKETWVKNSWRARGRPILSESLASLLKVKLLFFILKGSPLFFKRRRAKTTLTACAKTVAIAAPAVFILKTAHNRRSPTIFTTHATATKMSGDLLSPSPLKIDERRLYATMKKIPPPHILTY